MEPRERRAADSRLAKTDVGSVTTLSIVTTVEVRSARKALGRLTDQDLTPFERTV
jgi:hypothetical protein